MVDEVSKDKIKKMIGMCKDKRLKKEFDDIRKEIKNLPESDNKEDILMSFDAMVDIFYMQSLIIEYLLKNDSP